MKDCALAILFNADKSEILLTKRRDVPLWVLPGGGIEQGEEIETALLREVFEETCLHVAIVRKTGFYTPINRLASPAHVFECSYKAGTPTLSPETQGIAYFPLAQLPKNFFFLHHDWLNDALEHEKTIVKPIHQVTYLALFKYFFQHPIQVIRALLARLGFPLNEAGQKLK